MAKYTCFINFYVTLNLHFNTQDKYFSQSKIFVLIASSERGQSILNSNIYKWLQDFILQQGKRSQFQITNNNGPWRLKWDEGLQTHKLQ